MSLHSPTAPAIIFKLRYNHSIFLTKPHQAFDDCSQQEGQKNTCLQNLIEHSSTIRRFLSPCDSWDVHWDVSLGLLQNVGTISKHLSTLILCAGVLNPVSGTSIPFPNTFSKGSSWSFCSLCLECFCPWWNPTYQSQETNILCNTVGPHHPRQI